jgi:hypothetical protein
MVKIEANDDPEGVNAEGTSTTPKALKGRGRKAKAEANGEDAKAGGTSTKAKATKERAKKLKAQAKEDNEGKNLLLFGGSGLPECRGSWGVSNNTGLSDYIADDDELEPQTDAHQTRKNHQKKRKSSHIVPVEPGNDGVEESKGMPAKRPPKKIKVEPTPDGQDMEAKGNEPEGPSGRIAKNGRRKKTGAPRKQNSGVLDEPEPAGEDGKEAAKVEQIDGTTDFNAKAGVKTKPETVTKPPPRISRRGKPSKALKVRHAEEDANTARDASAGSAAELQEAPETEEDLEPATRATPETALKVEYRGEDVGATARSTPAEPEPKTAPAPGREQDKPKAKTGKKGIAKTVAKQRISRSLFVWPVSMTDQRISELC